MQPTIAVQQLNETFKIDVDDSILLYFPQKKHSLVDAIQSVIHRLFHAIKTGFWINQKKLCAFVSQHKEAHLSTLFQNTPLYRKLRRIEYDLVLKPISPLTVLLEKLAFLWRFIKSPFTIGALLPSSRALAKAMVRQISKTSSDEKRYILEVGPGTGVFTDRIIKRMNPQDELHLVELDFPEELKKKYDHLKNVHVYGGSIEKFESNIRFDCIISGLPFNSFSAPCVRQILEKYKNISKENGSISYFEYMLLPSIKKLFMSKEGKKNMDAVLKAKADFYKQAGECTDNVWKNITPAKVLHHRIHHGT